jgi:hypothetical protein
MAKLIYSAITSLDGDAARRLAAAPKGSGPRLALRTRIQSVLADLTSFVGRRRELAEISRPHFCSHRCSHANGKNGT